MKNTFNKYRGWIGILLLYSLAQVSCKKDKSSPAETPVDMGGITWTPTATDKFIYDSLTVPYNVAVNYKWLPGQLAFPSEIVPPMETQVVPVLKALLNVAYAPYNQVTGNTTLLRKYLPKTLRLAGSAEYLSNGAMYLGQAEGGTAMLLFQVNTFSRMKADSNTFKQIMHTMHHEFGHILHQNKMYPTAFKTISTGYTGNWYNVQDSNARKMGFISAYAMSSPDEDFVEMISSMLSGGENGPTGNFDEYEYLLYQSWYSSPTPDAYYALKAKEAMVVDYFAKSWNIDFYALRSKCRAALDGYLQ